MHQKGVLIGLSRRISLHVLITASVENMFLSEKSLHLILIARTKHSPRTLSHHQTTPIHIVSFLFLLIESFLISLKRKCCVIYFIFTHCAPASSPGWQITLSIWLDLLMHRSQAALRVPKTHIRCSNTHAWSPTLSSPVIVLAVDYN